MREGPSNTNQTYMETSEPCLGCESLGRLVSKDEPTGLIRMVCVSCGRETTVYQVDPDGNDYRPSMYDGQPCSIPYPKEDWEDAINSLVCCKREIDRLAAYIQKELPKEIGRGDPRNGESAVDIATRLMGRLVELSGESKEA